MKQGKIQSGQIAPNFETTDVKGNKIALSNYKKKFVLLVFLRYSGCPWCNLALHRLTLEYSMLKKENCEVIAFIQSDPASIRSNIYDRHEVTPEFPIIPDSKKEFYELYGIQSSKTAAIRSIRAVPDWLKSSRKYGFKQTKVDGDLFLVPAAFLISPQGKVLKTDYGTSFYEFESFFKIYESLVFDYH